METSQRYAGLIAAVRSASPLVHQLTNFVTVNDCANITLAIGASPVMSLSPDEAADMGGFAAAVVLNMGTPTRDWLASALAAGAAAKRRGAPVVFDPVGVGATPFRREVGAEVMAKVKPDIVKGNIAEIRFLAGLEASMRGVDSLDSAGAPAACAALARASGCVALATGELDCVSDGTETWEIAGGCKILGQLCGTGCMTAALAGGFAGSGAPALVAALAASLAMKTAGERAAAALGSRPELALPSAPGKPGPVGLGGLRAAMLDAVCALADGDLDFVGRLRRVQA